MLRLAVHAVDGQAFDEDVLHVPSPHDRKDEAGRGAVRRHVIEVQRCGDAERVGADLCSQGGSSHRKAVPGALVSNCHAVADLETGRIGDGDLALVAVAIGRQERLKAVTGGEDRLARDADHVDVLAERECIAHQVAARPNPHDAAAQAGDIIDGRLQHSVVSAAEVPLVNPHPDFRTPHLVGGAHRAAPANSRHRRDGHAQTDPGNSICRRTL